MPKPELSNKKKWNNSDEFYLAIWNENDTNFKNMMRGGVLPVKRTIKNNKVWTASCVDSWRYYYAAL